VSGRGWHRASLALLAVAALLVAALFRDYGVTWDEHFHDTYGKAVLRHFESGFSDQGALTYFNLWLYGAAFDATAALAKRLLPFEDYETQHLAIAAAGLAGAWAAVRAGTLAGGPRAGFIAGAALLALPSWWGHMFVNPKDVPFAAAMAWTLYWSMRASREGPRPSNATLAWLGLSLGATLGVRIAGVYAGIFPALAFAWTARAIWQARPPAERARAVAAAAARYAGAGALAYATMLAFWPWALRAPLRRPFEALATFAASPWDINVLFEGRLVSSTALPAEYLAVYLGAKLPLAALAALALAALFAVRAVRAGGLACVRPDLSLLAVAILLPLAAFPLVRPITYDGIRHFLFLLPPLAVAAALGIDGLLQRATSLPTRAAACACLGAAFAAHAGEVAALHPYEYVYYNALAGGTGGAAGSFELDYWGSSYREAALALDDFVAREDAQARYSVFVCAEGSSAAPFLSPQLRLADSDVAADFYLSTTRLGCDGEYDGKTILTVARDGAVFAVVKDRRGLGGRPDARMARPVPGALVAPRHPGLDGAAEAPLGTIR
jgi:hypothetical protein